METFTTIPRAIELLRDDTNYYGEFGKQFLSNSDIGALINNPKLFGIPEEDNKSLAEGRYFHASLLEPTKAVDTPFVDCANRNTNTYKDFIKDNGLDFVLLKSEMEAIRWLVSIMKGNVTFFDEIYAKGNKFEEPMVGDIKGLMWKGKADVERIDSVIDLKTTSDILQFPYSARKYNYDSQGYIYEKLFGKPLMFYVIDKNTGQLGIFRPTAQFLARGEAKMERAMAVYNKYFAPGHPDDILEYYIDEYLD